jgi:hypothetical protein
VHSDGGNKAENRRPGQLSSTPVILQGRLMTSITLCLPEDLIDRILDLNAEETGRVERKLSLLGSGPDAKGRTPADPHEDVVAAASGIGNAFPEQECYLVFGQDDAGNIAGQVGHDGVAISSQKATGARQRLATGLGKLGMPLRWTRSERQGRALWIAAFDGRQRGHYFVDTEGRPRVRSGGHTLIASPEQVATWVSETPTGRTTAAAQQRHRERLSRLGRTLDVRPLGVEIPALNVESPGSGLEGTAADARTGLLGDLVLNRGRVLLTGLPGSGKTTALQQLQALWAEDDDGPLPISVSATAVEGFLAQGHPADVAVVHAALDSVPQVDRELMAGVIDTTLQSGNAALFIDALDEARAAAATVVAAISALLRGSHADVEAIVSTRDSAYAQGHTLGFADIRLEKPRDLDVTMRRIAEALAEQAGVGEPERSAWIRTRLDWVHSVREQDAGFFETPMLSVLLLAASARHDTDHLPRSRSKILKLLVDDAAIHREVPRRGRPAAVATLQETPAIEAIIDGFRLIGDMVAGAAEVLEGTIDDALIRLLEEDYGLARGLARAGARDIRTFWDEAGVFVASGAKGVVRARVRLLSELAAAMIGVEQPQEEMALWLRALLDSADRTEVAVLAAGLNPDAAAALITAAVARGDIESLLLSVRAITLGAEPPIAARLQLVDRLIELLDEAEHQLNAGRALTQILVPADRRPGVLDAIAVNLPDPEATVFRAMALVTWQVQGSELEEALRAVLTIEPRAEAQRGVVPRDILLGSALAAAAGRLVPIDPHFVQQIVGTANRMGLSLRDVGIIDEALRRVGHAGAFFTPSRARSVAAFAASATSNDWTTGMQDWLQQLARLPHSRVERGELRRLQRLRDFFHTVGIPEATPGEVDDTVRSGEAPEVTEVICILSGIEVGKLAVEADAFVDKIPEGEAIGKLSRLFDGEPLELHHWNDIDDSEVFRGRLTTLLSGTRLAARVAARALGTDPTPGAAAAAVHAVLPTLAGINFFTACEALRTLEGNAFPPFEEWARHEHAQYRMMAAWSAPQKVADGSLDRARFAALAADVDDSVRDSLKRATNATDGTEELRELYGAVSRRTAAAQWTCLECGQVNTMDLLECPQCRRHGPGVSIRIAVDDSEPSGLVRDH